MENVLTIGFSQYYCDCFNGCLRPFTFLLRISINNKYIPSHVTPLSTSYLYDVIKYLCTFVTKYPKY